MSSYKLYIILYIELFLGLFASVAGAGGNAETSTKHQTFTVLPLIMLKRLEGTLTYPKSISTYSTKEGFSIKGTMFNSDRGSTIIRQLFFCGPDDKNGGNKINIFLMGTDKYCSFASDFQNSDPLSCPNQPEPFIRKFIVYNSSKDKYIPLACGPDDKEGETYAFQYKACTTTYRYEKPEGLRLAIREDFEIYRFCYSQKENQVLYTEHTIKSPRLLEDIRLVKEREETFPIITKQYECWDLDIKKIKKTYDEMENQNENEKLLVQKFDTSWIGKSPLHVQKLVPHEDLAFATWRKTTYHVANYKPMREDVKKLWEYINQLIREDAIKNNKEYKIYTGAFNTPEGEQTSHTVPVADLWIKIIQYSLPFSTNYSTESFAILLNNNLDRESMDSAFDRICAMNLCVEGFTEKFPKLGDTVRCCVATPDIWSFFNINIYNSDVTFMIDSFKKKNK